MGIRVVDRLIFYLRVEGRVGWETGSVEREMQRHSEILLDSIGISGTEIRVSERTLVERH